MVSSGRRPNVTLVKNAVSPGWKNLRNSDMKGSSKPFTKFAIAFAKPRMTQGRHIPP